ncbi:MAG TPA: ELWxxDGT repeat protein, partial [Thermoanaerobaculia bacterium]|nr:ELWxxDGT repeat protein [Thermoanaerobaculia bacterium]
VVFDPARVPTAHFSSYTPVNGRVVFLGFLTSDDVLEAVPECSLWTTDGTAEGTELLVELCGEADTTQDIGNVRILATNGSVALFTDLHGRIWRTDGTAAGTFRLGNVTGGGPTLVGPDGRTFFFAGCNRPFGCEPWKSDGTREGTAMIRDLRPGRRSSNPVLFIRDRGRVLFAASSGVWATDGTAAGTVELARVSQGSIEQILPHEGQVFFTVFSGNAEVWVAGPKPETPRLVQSLPSAHWRYSGLRLESAGGRLFLTRFDSDSNTTTLWETNGTSRGTRQLVRFEGSLSQFFTLGGNRVVFAASREEGQLPQLWYLDRGMKSPRRLGSPRLLPQSLTQLGNRLFFAAGPENDPSLWVTDGTRGGARLVQDLCTGTCESSAFLFRTALGHLFFTDEEGRLFTTDESGEPVLLAQTPPPGYDGLVDLAPLEGGRIVFSGFDERDGPQPWVSDLTPAGTDRILPLGTTLAAGGWIWNLTPFGGKVLFSGCNGESSGVFVSDGTAAGTFLLTGTVEPTEGVCKSFYPFEKFTVLEDVALFYANGKLWRTDGTPGGTSPVLTLDVPFIRGQVALGDRLLFVLDPPNLSNPNEWVWEFWTSDGTEAGTGKAFGLRLGGTPTGFVSVGGEVFFIAQSAESPFPYTLWRTDGTEAGTRKLVAVDYPTSGIPIEAVRLGGKTILALGGAGRSFSELWVTDGTAAGTVPLFADPAAPGPKNPFGLTVFKNAVWFFTGTGNPTDGLEEPFALWRSDGTAAGTRLIKSLSPPRTDYGFLAPLLTPVGDTLFFRADDGVHGSELWKTDGTNEGTVLVADVAPGAANAHPTAFAAFDGKLWFAATDGVHGLELWVSDGTAAGTRLAQDIFPGPTPSAPEQLKAVAGKLFFTANDGVHGRELWVETSPH